MCLTVPRKIEEIVDNKARLQDGRWARLDMLEETVEVGDMVLVQADLVIEKVSKERVKAMKEMMGVED